MVINYIEVGQCLFEKIQYCIVKTMAMELWQWNTTDGVLDI